MGHQRKAAVLHIMFDCCDVCVFALFERPDCGAPTGGGRCTMVHLVAPLGCGCRGGTGTPDYLKKYHAVPLGQVTCRSSWTGHMPWTGHMLYRFNWANNWNLKFERLYDVGIFCVHNDLSLQGIENYLRCCAARIPQEFAVLALRTARHSGKNHRNTDERHIARCKTKAISTHFCDGRLD